MHCIGPAPNLRSIFEEGGKGGKGNKKCRCGVLLLNPHIVGRSFRYATRSIAVLSFPGRRTLARDYERMEFLIKFPFSSFFPPLCLDRPGRCRRSPARAFFPSPFLPVAEQTKPGVEVVGNNISVGVVMVAEYWSFAPRNHFALPLGLAGPFRKLS